MTTEQPYDKSEFQAHAAELLSSAFKTLDEWRHLPAYQLERRVDVFFGLLLPKIVERKFGWPRDNLTVIPEFPLHKGLVFGSRGKNGKSDNHSVNVDFAVFYNGIERGRVLLVELKTDNNSIKEEQLCRMKKAQAAGMKNLVKGVVECANHKPRKYAQLIWKLHEIGCIEIPNEEDYKKMCMEDKRPGLAKNFKALKKALKSQDVCANWNIEDKVLLIYPPRKVKDRLSKVDKLLTTPPDWLRLVDFYDVRKTAGNEHPLSWFLMQWAQCEAGRISPWAEQDVK